ncbi:gastric inhibitory polypeptide [Acanthopagrus latus]|uniref:gastric inhibitory polypeptide n=1 Tax=Acanthopagrus latus TaxID=8177 RepID=UPI00187CC58A|nr:gastric inhibitory polypeptide [Acanthopagrus latus]
MKMLSELLVICLLGVLHANALPEEMRRENPVAQGQKHAQIKRGNEDVQRVVRRYVESTIASEISQIMDLIQQRNFVNYLLSQRVGEKRKSATGGEHPKRRLYSNLLTLSLQEKQKRHV